MKKKVNDTKYVSSLVEKNRLVEMVYNPELERTSFVVFENSAIRIQDSITTPSGTYKPLGLDNNIVTRGVILFPSVAEEYGSDEALIIEIQEFIHRYLAVSPRYERIASYYALFTWVYDKFNELPYLRALGDYGSGKTRFLQVIGSICYKPIFAAGATTVSPIFRMLDIHRGTLVFDEADFRLSDQTADIVKILNSGYMKGFPVWRSDTSKNGNFEPQFFNIFSPKILATRGQFQDKALESRFLIEEMGKGKLRADIPITLPDCFHDEARALRNKLLTWRLRNFYKPVLEEVWRGVNIQSRLLQITAPLLAIGTSEIFRSDIKQFIKEYESELTTDRSLSEEADILRALLVCRVRNTEPTIKQITEEYNSTFASKNQIEYRKMGSLVRNRLQLKVERLNVGWAVLARINEERIEFLKERYGVTEVNVVNNVNVVEKRGDEIKELDPREVSPFDTSF